jgi:hypothetical protein
MKRLALYGSGGAGKSSCARFMQEKMDEIELKIVRVRLAEPLYALQEAVYSAAGRPLDDPTTQDEALLSSIASHMRRINPEALIWPLWRHIDNALASERIPDLLVCEDSRPPDRRYLTELKFKFLHIDAPAEALISRRQSRRDISPTPAPAITECQAGDTSLRNDSTIDLFRMRVRAFMSDYIGDPNRY